MTIDQSSTRTKIKEAANKLFAEFGYDGTSVRDIAKHSGVNLASINYHFKSKEALYWEIFLSAQTWLEAGIEKTAESSENLEQLMKGMYDYITNDRDYVRNAIRLLLEENIAPPENPELMEKLAAGPPGEAIFGKFIREEIDDELSDDQVFWAVKSLIGALMHWGMMCSTSKLNLIQEVNPRISNDAIKEGLGRLSQAILLYLRAEKF